MTTGTNLDPLPAGECPHVLSDTADEPDRCTICDRLVCPDCSRTVSYDPDHGHYWHDDGSECFLHGGEPWRHAVPS